MKMNGQIVEEMKKNFVFVQIDFEDNGEDLGYFVFRKEEVSEEKITELWETYNELYQSDEYNGAFEDYLQEQGINYDKLTFLSL